VNEEEKMDKEVQEVVDGILGILENFKDNPTLTLQRLWNEIVLNSTYINSKNMFEDYRNWRNEYIKEKGFDTRDFLKIIKNDQQKEGDTGE
jgi:hypothetical protein